MLAEYRQSTGKMPVPQSWRRTARPRAGSRATNLAAYRKPWARRRQTYVRHSEYASHGFRIIQLQGRSGCIDRVRLWFKKSRMGVKNG